MYSKSKAPVTGNAQPANFDLRLATLADSATLLAWRNDPDTRKASLIPDIVSKEDHQQWLEGSLKSATRTIWIAHVGETCLGTARLDTANDRQELSWAVAPGARGRGIGTAMVRAVLAKTKGPVQARIRPENTASQKVARACNFARVASEHGVETWLFPHG